MQILLIIIIVLTIIKIQISETFLASAISSITGKSLKKLFFVFINNNLNKGSAMSKTSNCENWSNFGPCFNTNDRSFWSHLPLECYQNRYMQVNK